MKVLVIGAGGREHALAWKLAQSPRVSKVYVAPGNAGTAAEEGVDNVALTAIPDLIEFARNEAIALTVVGPEAPLAEGIVDAFQRRRATESSARRQKAAQLESSKDFAKAFMTRHGIPTAAYATFTDASAGARLYRPAGRADRDQGRRAGCRQGRGGGRGSCRKRMPQST